MKKFEEVFIVYNFTENEGESNSHYQILYFFDSHGEVTLDSQQKLNEAGAQIKKTIEFQTKENFIEFVQDFIDTHDYQTGHTLSADDFNIGIESCHNLFTFREIFKRYGTQIHRSEDAKKSLLGKFF